jgi:hypothetical protein
MSIAKVSVMTQRDTTGVSSGKNGPDTSFATRFHDIDTKIETDPAKQRVVVLALEGDRGSEEKLKQLLGDHHIQPDTRDYQSAIIILMGKVADYQGSVTTGSSAGKAGIWTSLLKGLAATGAITLSALAVTPGLKGERFTESDATRVVAASFHYPSSDQITINNEKENTQFTAAAIEAPKINNGVGVLSFNDLNDSSLAESNTMIKFASELLKLSPKYQDLNDDTKIIFAPFEAKTVDLKSVNLPDAEKAQIKKSFEEYRASFADQKIHPPVTFAMPTGSNLVFFNSKIFSSEKNPSQLLKIPASDFNPAYGRNGEPVYTEIARDLSVLGDKFEDSKTYGEHRVSTKEAFEVLVKELIHLVNMTPSTVAKVTSN